MPGDTAGDWLTKRAILSTIERCNSVMTMDAFEVAHLNTVPNLEQIASDRQIPYHVLHKYWVIKSLHCDVPLIGTLDDRIDRSRTDRSDHRNRLAR